MVQSAVPTAKENATATRVKRVLSANRLGHQNIPIRIRQYHSSESSERAPLIKQIPVGRFGQPSEIANAVVFLASDEAAFTVGTEVLIDGGMSL